MYERYPDRYVQEGPLPRYGTWDTTGYSRLVAGIHPTGMLSCSFCVMCGLFTAEDNVPRISPFLPRYCKDVI